MDLRLYYVLLSKEKRRLVGPPRPPLEDPLLAAARSISVLRGSRLGKRFRKYLEDFGDWIAEVGVNFLSEFEVELSVGESLGDARYMERLFAAWLAARGIANPTSYDGVGDLAARLREFESRVEKSRKEEKKRAAPGAGPVEEEFRVVGPVYGRTPISSWLRKRWVR